MTLRQLVDRYLTVAKHFGTSIPISSFELHHPEAERLFSSYDEDYHISRFFHFTEESAAEKFSINGEAATHVSLEAEIESIL